MKSYELKPTHENLMETLISDTLDRNKDIFWFADILNSLEDNCSIAIDGSTVYHGYIYNVPMREWYDDNCK